VNITWLVASDIISLALLIERMSCAPARVFKLPGGSLRRGSAADVTVFDPFVKWVVEPSAFKSKGRNTPYTGRTLSGRTRFTLVDGAVVHRDT
jgi:dihydroorotase